MRAGEILGLLWADIDFKEKVIHIKRTAYRVTKQGIVSSEPKTGKSKSKINVPQFVIDALLLHQERQAEKRAKAGTKWEEHNLVFTNRVGGYMSREYYLGIKFKQMLKKANLPKMRFHDLRHSAATILLIMGVHPKQAQEILRHSNIATTMNRYSHVLPSMQKKVMDDLDTFFKNE